MMPTDFPGTIAEEPDPADDWANPETAEEVCDAHPTKSFLAHAFVYGLGGLIIQAASIVLLPLYTHHLEPADYGILEILNRVGEVLSICLMAGGIRLAALTFYNQAKSDVERDKTVTSVTFMVVLLLIAGGIATIAFPRQIGAAIGIEDTRLVVFGMFAMLLDITIAVPMTLIQARTESLLYSCLAFAMFLFRVIAIIIAVVVFHWGIWGILGATALTSSLFGVVLTWREAPLCRALHSHGVVLLRVPQRGPFPAAKICRTRGRRHLCPRLSDCIHRRRVHSRSVAAGMVGTHVRSL
jgi:O-antigen/teichoic acid export membrane protein